MVNAMKVFGNWFFRLFAVALALSIVLPSSALAATLNFNSNNGNSNNAVLSALNDSDTCSGNWSYSGSVFTCNGSVVFDDGDDIRTNLSSVTIRAEAGIRVRDNSVGTANNRINLQTTYGLLRVDDESVIYGNLSSSSGGIQITGDDSNDRASIIGSLSSDAAINATEADITGAIQTTYGSINFDDVNVTGNISSSSGSLDFDDGDVTGTITTGGSATFKSGSSVTGAVSATNSVNATNTVFGSTLTSNGDISLTGGSVAGQVWSQSNGVTTNNTTLNGGARSQDDMNITGGTVQGAFIFQSANPMTMTNVNFTSGSITGPSTANIVNSTLGSSSSSLTVTVATNDINVTGSTVYANMTAPGTAKITNSTYTGDVSVNTGKVELDNAVVTGNVSSAGNGVEIKNGSSLTGNASVTGSGKVILDSSTVNGDLSASKNDIEINNSSILIGNATAGDGYKVKVASSSDVQGQCLPAREPETACGSAPPANQTPYWNFNQTVWTGASAEVLDSSVKTLHGRALNGAFTSRAAPAIPTSNGLGTCEYGEFSGSGSSASSSFIQVPYSSYMNSANTFSVAFWMKMPSAAQTGDIQSLMTFGLDRLVSNTRFTVYRNTSGNLTFLITMADNSSQSLIYSTTTAFNGSWNHIAASYNVSSRQMKLYVNGSVQSFTVPPSANSTPKNISSVSGAALGIGAFPDQTFGMTGQMDNARFYNKELTQNEINALMTETSTCSVTPAQPTQLFWNFNQSSWTGAAGEVTEETTPTLNGTAIGGAFTADISPALVANSSGGTCEYGNFTGTGATANSSLVQVPLNSTMNSANSFSLAFWMKMQGSNQQSDTQVFTVYGLSSTSNLRFVVARVYGYLAFVITMADNSTQVVYSSDTTIFNNNWQHVTATYSYSSRRLRLYVNGQETQHDFTTSDNSARTPKTISSVNGAAFSMGAFTNRTYGMTGQMDNVRFYNKELNSTEVNALRNERSACVSAEPVLSWNLNVASWTGAAGEVLDTSGNSLSGRTYNSLLSSITAPALTGDPGTCSFSQFNGTDQYIAVADNAKLDITDELTVAIWVRPKAYPGSGLMTILSKDTNYEFHIMPDGKINWWWHDQDGVERTLTSNGSVPLNQWTHVAITYKNGAQRIYLNGSVDSSIGSYTKKLATNNLALEVGRDNAANRYFNGDLDEVRIYAKAQNPVKIEEIKQERGSCSVIASCLLTEQFNDYTQWYRTVLSGTAPSVVNGRLQLTNNGTYQSTAITFKQGFPTAGNKLTIEFDHFAYGGNGADGIGLVLSDATVTPVPGSFGGSLGYAPRNTVSPVQPGFAGGWLGIGFDEFGNYAKATEGRTGGVANNVDSAQAIGVRGAGTTGYSWLGWSGKLSRSLSISGNTPGRGDRFRITLDTATNAGQVSFSLQRREAGGSTFTEVLNSSTINLTNQPAMPTNFLLSFTGSTGANTNFHAIDNVQVCSFKAPIPVPIGEPSIHHFELSYDSSGLTCASSNVTIKACANEACTALYSGEVTVNLDADNGGSWVGGNSVTFTGGQTTKALTKTISGATVLSVTSSSVGAANNPVCYEGGVLDAACSMNFLDTGLRFSSIPNQVAGLVSPSQVQLQVVRTNTQTGACVARVTPTSTVQFGYQCVDPVSCIAEQTFKIDNSSIASNPAASVTQYSDVTRSFDSNAATNFNITYSDVGKVKLYAKLVLSAQGTQPAITLEQQSNEFIVRPDRIVVSAVTSSAGTTNPGGTSTGAGFVAAGEEFKIVLDVVNRLGALTPNFGRETTAEAVSISSSLAYPILSGVPCAVGTANCISAPSVSFNNPAFTAVSGVAGRFENTTAKWLQVGSLNINGKLEDQNYLGAGDTASTNLSVVVGRFYPHHFALISATLDDGCVAGNFSYMDSASISSNVRVQAMAVDGSTVLTNYNAGNNKAYAGIAAVSLVAENANNGQNLASRIETTLPSWVDGSWLWQAANTDFAKRNDMVPDGPYSALQLGLAITSERDNRTFNVLTMNPATNADCVATATCNAAQVGSALDVRYGRFMLQNAAGPEDQNLPVSLQSQYWNGNVFTQNLQDSCSSFDPNSLVVSGVTTSKGGTAGSIVAGQNPLNSIFIPAPNTTGVATLQYQIPLQLQYMQFPWNGGTTLVNPTAEANFGRFRGNKRQIFWQERLN